MVLLLGWLGLGLWMSLEGGCLGRSVGFAVAFPESSTASLNAAPCLTFGGVGFKVFWRLLFFLTATCRRLSRLRPKRVGRGRGLWALKKKGGKAIQPSPPC